MGGLLEMIGRNYSHTIAIGDRSQARGDYVFAFSANGLNYSARVSWLEWFFIRRAVLRAVKNPEPLSRPDMS